MPDHIAALRQLLLNDTELRALCGDRVYGGTRLPDRIIGAMPTNAVVLAYSGGVGAIGIGAQSYGDVRVDATAYGPTEGDAAAVYRAVHVALKGFQRRVFAGMLLHWARPAGGPLSLRDPDAGWPFVLSSWQVLASETPVPGG